MKEHPRMTVIRRSNRNMVAYDTRRAALTERLAALPYAELVAWCDRRFKTATGDALVDMLTVCFNPKRGVAA